MTSEKLRARLNGHEGATAPVGKPDIAGDAR